MEGQWQVLGGCGAQRFSQVEHTEYEWRLTEGRDRRAVVTILYGRTYVYRAWSNQNDWVGASLAVGRLAAFMRRASSST